MTDDDAKVLGVCIGLLIYLASLSVSFWGLGYSADYIASQREGVPTRGNPAVRLATPFTPIGIGAGIFTALIDSPSDVPTPNQVKKEGW
jgi:hypothetical protein